MWICFAVGLGLASLDLGLGQAQLRVSGCAESWIRVDSWLVQGGLMVGLRLVWSDSGLVRVGVGLAQVGF